MTQKEFKYKKFMQIFYNGLFLLGYARLVTFANIISSQAVLKK
jgi:hypothetical protein